VVHPRADIKGLTGIDDPYLGPFGSRCSFNGVTLGETGGRFCPVPQRLVQSPVEDRSFFDEECPERVISRIVVLDPLLGECGPLWNDQTGKEKKQGESPGWMNTVLQLRTLLMRPTLMECKTESERRYTPALRSTDFAV